MRPRLYFDEDSSRHSLARELRFRGADVMTAPEAGTLGKDDEDQLEWATAQGRVLYSFNQRDFYALHSAWLVSGRSHAEIILGRQETSIGEQMRRLLRLLSALTADQMRDRVEFLTGW